MAEDTKIKKIYYSIGDVSKLFNVNTSLIRHWEKEFNILKPHKNNKGNRQFTQADIDNLHLIYYLVKEKGMTLKGAKQKLKENKEKTEKTFEIIKRLKKVKAELIDIRNSINNKETADSTNSPTP